MKFIIALLLACAHNPAYAKYLDPTEKMIAETEALAFEGYGICSGYKNPNLIGACRAEMVLRLVAVKQLKICYKAFKRSSDYTKMSFQNWNMFTKCDP